MSYLPCDMTKILLVGNYVYLSLFFKLPTALKIHVKVFRRELSLYNLVYCFRIACTLHCKY